MPPVDRPGSVAAIVARILRRRGVEHAFGLRDERAAAHIARAHAGITG